MLVDKDTQQIQRYIFKDRIAFYYVLCSCNPEHHRSRNLYKDVQIISRSCTANLKLEIYIKHLFLSNHRISTFFTKSCLLLRNFNGTSSKINRKIRNGPKFQCNINMTVMQKSSFFKKYMELKYFKNSLTGPLALSHCYIQKLNHQFMRGISIGQQP